MTTKQIKSELAAQLEKNKSDLSEFNALLKAAELNKWQINKRIEKHLPDGCRYYTEYSMYYVKFPSGNAHLLGWVGSTHELSPESLRHSDSWASNGAEERIKQLECILLPENVGKYCALFISLHKAVNSVHKAIGDIEAAGMGSYKNPAYYDMIKMAGFSQKELF